MKSHIKSVNFFTRQRPIIRVAAPDHPCGSARSTVRQRSIIRVAAPDHPCGSARSTVRQRSIICVTDSLNKR